MAIDDAACLKILNAHCLEFGIQADDPARDSAAHIIEILVMMGTYSVEQIEQSLRAAQHFKDRR
jgi:hypothetical protein